MNRRRAIAWALGGALAGITCGVAGLRGVGRLSSLSASLADLYDERFVEALPQISLGGVATRLATRGVLVGATGEDEGQPSPLCSWPPETERRGWRLDVDRVGANAADDALVEFGRSLYTETELLLYSFVARLRSSAAAALLAPDTNAMNQRTAVAGTSGAAVELPLRSIPAPVTPESVGADAAALGGRHGLAPGGAAGGRVSRSREVAEGRWDA